LSSARSAIKDGVGSLGAPWLVRIRWAAVFGQLLVFLGANWLMGISLSWGPFLIVSAVVAFSNIFLLLPRGSTWLEARRSQGIVLVADVLLLTALLYSYGGHTNPFSMVYLVHVVLAALLLGSAWTWGISIFCSLCYAFLFRWYLPVPELSMGHMHGSGDEFNLHLQGMLVGFVLISFLVSGFLQRMRAEIDWREKELGRRRSNEEKLAAVTTIAASVAHELGTPLGSMMLVVDDILAELRQGGDDSNIGKDVGVLRAQLDRCAEAMRRLGQNSGELFGEMPQEFSIKDLLESIHGGLASADARRVHIKPDGAVQSVVLPMEGVRHIISAVIKNALEASIIGKGVSVSVNGTSKAIHLTVEDCGKGMNAEDLQRIGEPFFTTKDSGRGMGLGLFITKLFSERLGGAFKIESTVGKGTKVEIELPRVVAWEPES
jgi:two-component system sensor histidine kinase RegB